MLQPEDDSHGTFQPKLLALGDREIEREQHLDADEVYTELAAE